MSRTAVFACDAYALAPLKSGSAQLPDFMILFGRYMTALMPSNGLVPSVDQAHVAGSRIRVVVSGPASSTRPSESTNMNGYSGEVSFDPVRSVHLFAAGSKTSGSELTEASL